mgnify:CR=1 FL=1
MATTLAKSISLDKNLKFVFVKNSTEDHFITSDQPVFNILNDKVNDMGEVTEIEFYYPISPEIAIRLHFDNSQVEKYVEESITSDKVEYFNRKVFDNSDFFIFADSNELLRKYRYK